MEWKPMHIVSTTLFVISLLGSIIGPYTEGYLRTGMFICAIVSLVAGWVFHIVGCQWE